MTILISLDLGHGPFSHVFDNLFIKKSRPKEHWEHEEASMMMLRYMIEQNNLDFDKYEINFLENLIMPKKIPSYDSERLFLYQVVANYQNSVDVDKFDYISRDSQNLGLHASFDPSRLMRFSKVIEGEICFHAKEAYNLYEMFHTRYSLHKQIYSHRVGKAISYMIRDAFLAADKFLGISDSIRDPERYGMMTDCILKEIENSKAPELKEAKAIIKRIRKRQLYKLADEILVPTSPGIEVTEEDIISYQEGKSLSVEDIIIDESKFNYAMKDRNPVDFVWFYTGNERFNLTKDSVSLLIPERFQERYIGIYCKDAGKIEDAKIAFKKWAEAQNITSSPFKGKHF